MTVMMSVSDVQALNALDASISYDSAYLQLDSVSVAETLAGWNLDWFSPTPGSVNVSMFTLNELSGPADMVALQFTLIAGSEQPIPVRLTRLVLNDIGGAGSRLRLSDRDILLRYHRASKLLG